MNDFVMQCNDIAKKRDSKTKTALSRRKATAIRGHLISVVHIIGLGSKAKGLEETCPIQVLE